MLGKVIGTRELAARWSFAEVTGRFAANYRAFHPDPDDALLMTKIQTGAPFDDLDNLERERLASWFDTGLRRDFARVFNHWYTSFRCVSWTKSQLARVHTLPIIDPLGRGRSFAFLSYLAHPRKRDGNGHLDSKDPAGAADLVPPDTPFNQREPLVIGHWDDGRLTLWEGNFRAVLFARTVDPKAEVLVWMPDEGTWPGKT